MRHFCFFTHEQPTRVSRRILISLEFFAISVARRHDSIDWMFNAMAGTLISVGDPGLFYLLLLFSQDWHQ